MNHEATIATLNMQLDNCAKDLYEKDLRIADLERQLAEASAPAVEQQTIQWTYGPSVWKDWCTQYFGPDADDNHLAKAVFNLPPMAQKFAQPATPQAADTDKVREAIPDGCALGWNGTIYHGISEIYHQMEEGAALHMVLDEKNVPRADKDGCVYSLVGRAEQYVAASMAAQAPVREVPGYKLVPIVPTPEMISAYDDYGMSTRAIWDAMLAAAPLPAAPV